MTFLNINKVKVTLPSVSCCPHTSAWSNQYTCTFYVPQQTSFISCCSHIIKSVFVCVLNDSQIISSCTAFPTYFFCISGLESLLHPLQMNEWNKNDRKSSSLTLLNGRTLTATLTQSLLWTSEALALMVQLAGGRTGGRLRPALSQNSTTLRGGQVTR